MCSSDTLSGFRGAEQKETIHILRWRRKRRALFKTWVQQWSAFSMTHNLQWHRVADLSAQTADALIWFISGLFLGLIPMCPLSHLSLSRPSWWILSKFSYPTLLFCCAVVWVSVSLQYFADVAWRGMLDETIPKSAWFLSCIYLRKTPYKTSRKTEVFPRKVTGRTRCL